MSRTLRAILVFCCVCLLETGWVVSVRLVTTGETWKLAGWAMLLQTIAYVGLFSVVDDRWLTVVGVIGAGVGAVLGMQLASLWS